MMTIVLESGDSWKGIRVTVMAFKSNSSCHRSRPRIGTRFSSMATWMPEWYSELENFAGFTSMHTLESIISQITVVDA